MWIFSSVVAMDTFQGCFLGLQSFCFGFGFGRGGDRLLRFLGTIFGRGLVTTQRTAVGWGGSLRPGLEVPTKARLLQHWLPFLVLKPGWVS